MQSGQGKQNFYHTLALYLSAFFRTHLHTLEASHATQVIFFSFIRVLITLSILILLFLILRICIVFFIPLFSY